MISKDEIVSKFYYPLYVIRVTLFQKQKELGLNSCLVVVFLLVLYEFNSHKLFVLVIHARNNLSKCSLSDNFNQLIPVGDMVIFLNSVVAFFVVETVIYKSFKLSRLNLRFVRA